MLHLEATLETATSYANTGADVQRADLTGAVKDQLNHINVVLKHLSEAFTHGKAWLGYM